MVGEIGDLVPDDIDDIPGLVDLKVQTRMSHGRHRCRDAGRGQHRGFEFVVQQSPHGPLGKDQADRGDQHEDHQAHDRELCGQTE